MRFSPDYKLNLIDEEEFLNVIPSVEKKLADIKNSGTFNAFDNTEIYYEYFLAENSKASIVVVHGLSEFVNKFYEFIYYCLNQGYNVFVYDQRCHGLSGRLTDRIELLHVDSFYDYAKDLSQFIDEVVTRVEDKPIYIYSHSMGGAVSALYLSQNSAKIKKAVLSAPMFEPVVDSVAYPIARMGVGIGRLFYGNKTKFLLTREFDPDVKYSEAHGTSRARFEHNMKMRRENPHYQSTPMTFGWIYNSLIIRDKIFKRKTIKNISTPMLLISAEKDTIVKLKPQYDFANKCKNCKLVNLKNTNHALLAGTSQTIGEVLNLVFDFYENND